MKRLTAILIAITTLLPGLQASRSSVKQNGDIPISSKENLAAGRFEWEAGKCNAGSVAVLVSLPRQMLYVYQGGVLIARSSVSSGRPGHTTPSGLFPIIGKEVMHYSNLYHHAPMPYMQRLTMEGVALHAGWIPGEPASHGCIRLPEEFARRLFGITSRGDLVLVVGRSGDVVKESGSDMPQVLAAAVRSLPAPPAGSVYSQTMFSPANSTKPAVADATTTRLSGKSMTQLENEELSIRNDPSLDRQARRDELLRIWSEQRALMGKP
jgi:hypothetical protein